VGRLGAQIVEVDQARFAGRGRELDLLDTILRDDGRVAVVFVHGPGGIGKSTLLREIARRADGLGYERFAVDGRELSPVPGELERALDGAQASERPLILLDTYERVAALGPHLRGRLLPRLSAHARVIVAGRQPPEEGWRQNGWDAVTLPVPLAPLSSDDAHALLTRRGLADAAASREIVAWAGGSPLALALAADGVVVSGRSAPLAALDDDGVLSGELVRRLVGEELDGADLDVVAVAAVAHSVDARLLGEVIPGVDGDHALAWLRGLSFAEPLGSAVTLHERVRRSLQAELRASDPLRDRELRCRVADHLFLRGRAGEPTRFLQLGELVRDPAVRFGFGVGASSTHRMDVVRDGDLEAVATALGAADEPWWPGLVRWFTDAPDSVMTVRDANGRLTGFGVMTMLSDAPPWAREDAVIARLIAHAQAVGDEDVLIRRDFIDLAAGPEGDVASASLALLNAAFALRACTTATRQQYCVVDARDRSSLEFNRNAGVDQLTALDGTIDGRALHYHLLDHGPDGIMATARALVYRDLGLTAGPRPVEREPLDAGVVRDALRAFRDPAVLATSPLARGVTVTERAASVRSRVQSAIEAELGHSGADQLLRAVLERGYLDADGSHERAILELYVSRATYFRRLADAVERVAPRVLGAQ
jgi:hypothetical protein